MDCISENSTTYDFVCIFSTRLGNLYETEFKFEEAKFNKVNSYLYHSFDNYTP